MRIVLLTSALLCAFYVAESAITTATQKAVFADLQQAACPHCDLCTSKKICKLTLGRSVCNILCRICKQAVCVNPQPGPSASAVFEVTNSGEGNFYGQVLLQLPQAVTGGWNMIIEFDRPVINLQIWLAKVDSIKDDSATYFLSNMPWNQDLSSGTHDIKFQGEVSGGPPASASIYFNGGVDVTSSVGSPVTPSPQSTQPSGQNTQLPSGENSTEAPQVGGSYDYVEVLHKSILFYEAQRSGRLPDNNRIPWRFDSALYDGSDVGLDLTGGWYDAGDYLKLGFPLASTLTVLAWGIIEYKEAYRAAGELDNALDSIKWVTDYFIKCHPSKFVFYAQIGNTVDDHSSWGRPQDMTMARPAKKVTASQPGSEVTAETASAMAAASIVFRRNGNTTYADELLQHARDLYEFADTYRGNYQDVITDTPYPSHTGYGDELTWGAAWLYRTTSEASYLSKAVQYYDQFDVNGGGFEFDWDKKNAGAMLLLANLTGTAKYRMDFNNYMMGKMPGNGATYSPRGLLHLYNWGSCRHAANHAFLALLGAELGYNVNTYRKFARQQINYMLGDFDRSLVVGFGHNPPVRVHHRAASCPVTGVCDWSTFRSPDPNANVLDGALVGGPNADDFYNDIRNNYIANEVTVDYNAGFQSAVAGLIQLNN